MVINAMGDLLPKMIQEGGDAVYVWSRPEYGNWDNEEYLPTVEARCAFYLLFLFLRP